MADVQLEAALRDWQAVLGTAKVMDEAAARQAYGHDTSGSPRRIGAALRIADAAEIPTVLKIARRHGVAVYPISTGRNWGYGSALPARDGCAILDLSGLSRILHFDATLGTVTVEPGVTQGQLAEFLDAGQHPFMVPVTGAGPDGSLLGNALERGYGLTPITDHFAAITDLEAVLADGTIYRSVLREAGAEELARVSRWGLGPAVNGLFSQAGFGVVTQATLRLAHRPPCCEVALFELRSDALLEPAVERVRALLLTLPGIIGGINLMNRHRVLAMATPYPSDRVGPSGVLPSAVVEALGHEYRLPPWTGFAALYGTTRTVAAARAEMRDQLNGVASRLLFLSARRTRRLARLASWLPGAPGQRMRQIAQTLNSATELVAGHPNRTALPLAYWRHPEGRQAQLTGDPARDGCGLIWYAPKLPLLGAQARAAAANVMEIAPRHGIEPLITFTATDPHTLDCTVPLLFERANPSAVVAARHCYAALFERGRRLGHLPYRLGSDQFSMLDGGPQGSAQLLQRLRAAFDPTDLLSPGRYVWPAS